MAPQAGQSPCLLHADDNSWSVVPINDSKYGCNAVTWAPYGHLGSTEGDQVVKRIATGSCDNLVRVFKCAAVEGGWEWKQEAALGGEGVGHSDWVRDVAWAPSSGMPCNTIASCSGVRLSSVCDRAWVRYLIMHSISQDGTVIIWKQQAGADWKPTKLPAFNSPVWRVSWSVTGNMLAVRGTPTPHLFVSACWLDVGVLQLLDA